MSRKRRNGNRNTQNFSDHHHIIPQARFRHDTILIPRVDHDKYHALFGTMSPDEAMAHIYYNYTTPEWRAAHKEIEG